MTLLRVCHIITQLELGGAQRNTLYTVSHLDAARFEPSLIVGKGGQLDDEAKQGSYPTVFLKSLVRPIRPIRDVVALIVLYRRLRQTKPHVVHTHSSKAGILGRIAAYLAGVPVIIHTFHGFGFTPGQRPWLRNFLIHIEKFCARISTHLIFVSEDNQREAETLEIGKTIPRSIIRSGIAFDDSPIPSTLRQDLELTDRDWIAISVGNFKPQKNPLDLIKVAARVIEKHPEAHFVIAGDGELREAVEHEITIRGLGSRVHLLGWRQDVTALLRASNAFVLTSLWEGLPRSILEAFSARLPVVAYAANGVKDVLRDGENGFLINSGDVESAADKLGWIYEHPSEAHTMGQAGRRILAEEFDINRMVRDQETLYKRLYENVPLKDYYEPRWMPLKS